eukprot:TRINITY_DN9915_c0_g1_i2.p1 TRINITY_DN9915_c0_g1~~TRINITY_DN9915_c0_g1_i2.p1  ORF type:complete len:265 (+),score=65.88 TRINITY_DN9915_c0_g1_i2:28-795(+)
MSSAAELKEMMNRKRAAREQERISKGEQGMASKIEEIKRNKKIQRAKIATNALLMGDDDTSVEPVVGYKRETAKAKVVHKIDNTAVLETAAQRRQAGIRNILLKSGFFDDPPPNTLPPGLVVLEPIEEDAAKAHLVSLTTEVAPASDNTAPSTGLTKVELNMEVIRMQKELAEEKERQLTSTAMLEAEQEWADSRTRDDAAASLEGQSLLDRIKARRDNITKRKPHQPATPAPVVDDDESDESDDAFTDWRMSKR